MIFSQVTHRGIKPDMDYRGNLVSAILHPPVKLHNNL